MLYGLQPRLGLVPRPLCHPPSFGIKEAVPAPTAATELVSPAPIPTASLITETPPTPPTPFTLLPTETPPAPKASAPHPVPAQ